MILKREIHAQNSSLSILLYFSVIYASKVMAVVSELWKYCTSICHTGCLRLTMAATEISKCYKPGLDALSC